MFNGFWAGLVNTRDIYIYIYAQSLESMVTNKEQGRQFPLCLVSLWYWFTGLLSAPQDEKPSVYVIFFCVPTILVESAL